MLLPLLSDVTEYSPPSLPSFTTVDSSESALDCEAIDSTLDFDNDCQKNSVADDE